MRREGQQFPVADEAEWGEADIEAQGEQER
jgi:hypothetical protein